MCSMRCGQCLHLVHTQWNTSHLSVNTDDSQVTSSPLWLILSCTQDFSSGGLHCPISFWILRLGDCITLLPSLLLPGIKYLARTLLLTPGSAQCPACHSPFFPLTSLTHPVEGLPAYCLDLGLLLCSKWINCSLSPVVFRDNLPVGDRSFRIFIKSQTTANTWGLTDILSCMVLVLLLHLFGCFSVSCGPKQNEQLTSWRFTF
jgi:hypothetical protein